MGRGENMTYKIAIASTDGKVINQHFGRTNVFYIVKDDGLKQTFHYVESRKVNPLCQGQEHDDKQLYALADTLKDCDYILVSQIGYGARCVLEEKQIGVFELPGFIEDSIKKLLTYIEVQKLLSE